MTNSVLEHGRMDSLNINYEGKWSVKQFAGTITSRKKFRTPIEFRTELYKFLQDINYNYAITGFAEYHEQKGRHDKVHAHVMLYSGSHPKNNKGNLFTFHIQKMESIRGWDNYMQKNTKNTLEKALAISTGFYDLLISRRKEGYCLFDD